MKFYGSRTDSGTPMDCLTLLKTLIEKPSTTPNDAGCQDLLIDLLTEAGFRITRLPQGQVENFWAEHGDSGPCLAFAGHTDVVAAGDLSLWDHDPFKPTIKDNTLYGRGAADMKSGLSAMVCAAIDFVTSNPNHNGRLGLLVTSGEEGDDYLDGTPVVMKHLYDHNQAIDYCVIGEASSHKKIADTLRVGRRGSLSGTLTIQGKQGHVAYPELVINPIHQIGTVIQNLAAEVWDQGNEHFPPTSLQITDIHAGDGSSNVVPSQAQIKFNFRYSSESQYEDLQTRVAKIVEHTTQDYTLEFRLSGEPFLTADGQLIQAACHAIQSECGYEAQLSTGGGTSDGRFIAPYGVEVIELGPINASIHKVNECIDLDDLETLQRLYLKIVSALL